MVLCVVVCSFGNLCAHVQHPSRNRPRISWLTSLNYWQHPIRDSWQRTLDVAVVFAGVSYQSYCAFQATSGTFYAYSIFIVISAGCYMISNYLLRHGKFWPATYTHASIHVFANIVLYSGT